MTNLLLPLLLLGTGISSSPHGYQYPLPKEYNTYSHDNSGSYSQLEPFRRFLKNYMSSYKSSQDNSPYHYMKHPMANVPVRSEMPKPSLYHQLVDRFNMDREQYMLGEFFFKKNGDLDNNKYNNDDFESPSYNVVEKFQAVDRTSSYEKRFYPSATYVCNRTKVDTAADPLAGLERMNPYEVINSKRFKTTPRSQMFRELLRYIQGENQDQQKVEMTSPVVVFHKVIKETTVGNYEEEEMCFYLPHKYQENHEHQENQRHEHVHVHDENHEHHEQDENHEHQENQRHEHVHDHDENHEHHEDDENHEHHEHNENHEHQENQRHKENHDHHEDQEHPEDQENHEHEDDVPSFRHAPLPPPQPMENGNVYLYTRPAMQVFVRTFGGIALTHQTWEEQREILEDDILGKKYNPAEYFTASYAHPLKVGNKRNEVWIQCLEPFQTLPGQVPDNLARNLPGGK